MFRLTSVPVLSEVVFTFLSSVVTLTANGKFWIVPLLHSMNDMYLGCSSHLVQTSCVSADVWNSNQEMLCLPTTRDNVTYFQESSTRCCGLLIRPMEIKISYSVTVERQSWQSWKSFYEIGYMGGMYIHRATKFCSASPYSFSVSVAFLFVPDVGKCVFSSHVPSRKHQVTVRFTDHSKIQGTQTGTCCMSSF
jgi:hypothetical protein